MFFPHLSDSCHVYQALQYGRMYNMEERQEVLRCLHYAQTISKVLKKKTSPIIYNFLGNILCRLDTKIQKLKLQIQRIWIFGAHLNIRQAWHTYKTFQCSTLCAIRLWQISSILLREHQCQLGPRLTWTGVLVSAGSVLSRLAGGKAAWSWSATLLPSVPITFFKYKLRGTDGEVTSPGDCTARPT